MEQFKDCQAIVPFLRQPGVSIEKKLAEFQEQARSYPSGYRELNAVRYYLRFALWNCQELWRSRHRGITNFVTFLREIERWRVEKKEQACLVTFNYDTILEEAMSQVLRLAVRDMDSYITWKDYSLFKLHGSVNWGLEVDGVTHPGNAVPYPYQELIDAVPDRCHVTKRYRLCVKAMWPTDDRVVLFPALSIPVENKDEFSCPSAHVAALGRLLPIATMVITVGWRATEVDFLEMLRASRSAPVSGIRPTLKILAVSGSKDGCEETLRNLAPYRGGYDPYLSLDKMVATGFTGLINDIGVLSAFLR